MMQLLTKNNKIILILFILVLIAVIIAVIIYFTMRNEFFQDLSASTNLFNNPRYEKDRTLLYGSLFLDKLDEQIKGMTDPRIEYDTKRIDIIKYADVLL